ncbi:MAG: type VI secretion system membrane subunit TssM [Burkholderiales bacterium]|nr:type VI secretion system membrane subunit TssM [Burkholderiales bacterium]
MMYYLRLIFRKLFNRITLAILLLLLLSAVIWFIGPLVSIGDLRPFAPTWVRWSLIALFWLFWLAKQALRWWRERNVNAALLNQLAKMQSAGKPSDGQVAGADEVAELNKRFKDAAEILKKTKFSSDEKGGFLSSLSKQYVYQLPWYAFIGAPGSGKTTALINAGLTFPLAEQFGKAAIRGIGGTRNCDWWFTNEAVLIDTAGRYTTQESNESIDKAEWQGFLALLKKFRPRQPLNGVLLTVSVADVLQMTAQEREVHAATLKARLAELREGLGIRFPVYVLVTKADLLSGFSEYFLNYTREDRAQVWGFTLPYDAKSTEPIAVRESFAQEFDLLYRRLNDGMHQRLLDEPDLSRRALAYTLPQQLVGIRDVLSRLLGAVFSDSKFSEQPMLRGVYFTSGTQEGTPFDRVLGAMQRTFRVPAKVRAAETVPGTGKSYFLQDLLQKVIFKESFIAGRNIVTERRMRWLRWGGMAASAIAFVWANVAWWMSYGNNSKYIAEVGTRADALRDSVAAIPATPSEDAPALLPTMTQARDVAHSANFDFDNPPWSYRYGLYQGQKLDSAAQNVYSRLIDDGLMPRIASRLTTRLRNAANEKSDTSYEALKAYLMMYETGRVKDEFIKNYVGADWMASIPPDVGTEARKQMLSHLDDILKQGAFKSPFPQDKALVQQVRDQLMQLDPAKRAYNFIKSQLIGIDLPEFTVVRAAGDRAPAVFMRQSGKSLSGAGVPGFFSERGYNEYFVKALSKWGAELAIEEAWVLGRGSGNATKLATAANDMARLDRRIRELYLADFGNEWQNFLADIRLKPPRSMNETIETANVLGSLDSPLVLLVRSVATETTLINTDTGPGNRVNQIKESVKRGLDEVTAATSALANAPINIDRPEMIVQERFKDFKQLAQPTGKGKIDELSRDVQEYAVSLRNDQIALSNGSTRRSQEADTRLASRAAQLPTPVREIIEALTGNVARLTKTTLQANAAAQVKGAVGQNCSAVVRGYPFDRRASQDAFGQDFAQVFGPDGSIKRAFDQIASSVDMSKDPWVPRAGPDGAAAGSPEDLRRFKQAQEIREVFFGAGKSQPGFELDIKVTAPGAEKVELDVDGMIVSSTEESKRVVWPGPKNGEKVKLGIAGKPAFVSTEGFWALHRLADKGNAQALGNAVVATFNTEGRDIRVELRARSFRHPLTLPALQRFGCPGR